jgi:hypothetical protein
MQKMLTRTTCNKRNECDLFSKSLHFAEELETIQTDFGLEFDAQLKELLTESAYVT